MIVKSGKRVLCDGGVVTSVLCVMAIVLGLIGSVRGCEVPVYLYMLERWERDFYAVYYFYSGEEDKADREVNEFLDDVAGSFGSHVNLAFRAAEVNGVSGEAVAVGDREVWNEYRAEKLPFHLVLTPLGRPLFRGRLDLAMAKAMIDSPMRKRIAQELCSGKGGLLLLVSGQDRKENERAEKDVRWVLTRAKQQGVDVGYLRMSRSDRGEKWLVRTLVDLLEKPPGESECMVFGICGRGKVLAACIGEGVTRRNIVDCVGMMNGDCSCDFKFTNAGMDLLTDWDWEGAIASLPAVTVQPLQSVLVGFDDSEEDVGVESPKKAEGGGEGGAGWLFGTSALVRWGLGFAIVSAIVVGIGLVIIRKRRVS